MKMKNSCFILLLLVLCVGCIDNPAIHKEAIVNNYIDSISNVSIVGVRERIVGIHVDEFPYGVATNIRYRVWIYADSVNKYISNEKLSQLTSSHKSVAVRYVTFKLLLNRDSHKAIDYLMHDINNTDSIYALRFDQGQMESLTSLRVELATKRKLYNISLKDSLALKKVIMKYKINYFPYTVKKY
jgi:hypothetical protein